MLRRRALVLLCSLATVVAATLSTGVATAPSIAATAATLATWDTTKPCPTILVIASRGSGEEDGHGGIPKNSPTLGLGPEVYGVASHLAQIVGDKGKGTVAVWNNTYPALAVSDYARKSPTLIGAVNQGIQNLQVMVHATVATCGAATRIVLAGYSLGAWVSNDGADALWSDADRRAIAALVLIASPEYSATDHGILVGTALKTQNGIIGPVGPPAYLKSKTVSLCDKGDAVCQADLVSR